MIHFIELPPDLTALLNKKIYFCLFVFILSQRNKKRTLFHFRTLTHGLNIKNIFSENELKVIIFKTV